MSKRHRIPDPQHCTPAGEGGSQFQRGDIHCGTLGVYLYGLCALNTWIIVQNQSILFPRRPILNCLEADNSYLTGGGTSVAVPVLGCARFASKRNEAKFKYIFLLFFAFFCFFCFFCFLSLFSLFLRFKFCASLRFSNFRFEAKRGGKLFRFKRSKIQYFSHYFASQLRFRWKKTIYNIPIQHVF